MNFKIRKEDEEYLILLIIKKSKKKIMYIAKSNAWNVKKFFKNLKI